MRFTFKADQELALEFILKNKRSGLFMPTGCLSGDTIVRINRNGVSRKKKIKYLFTQYYSRSVINKKFRFDLSINTRIRAYLGNKIGLDEVTDIIYSGKKELFELILENGFSVKATADHEILTRNGFIQLQDLDSYSMVAYDECRYFKKLNKSKKVWDSMVLGLKFHQYKRSVRMKHYHGGFTYRVTKSRLLCEARLNGLAYNEFINVIRHNEDKAKLLVYLDPKVFVVHHVDGNHYNNNLDNLRVLTRDKHLRLHGDTYANNFGNNQIKYTGVKSIKLVGVEDTYDIKCLSLFHNFVANGIVVHNCGKSIISLLYLKILDKSALIVAPACLKHIWQIENKKFELGLSISSDYRSPAKITVVSYDWVKNYPDVLKEYEIVVLDECLIGDTLIVKEDGGINTISTIISGRLYCGGNIKRHIKKRVVQLMKITTKDGQIITTLTHPHLTIVGNKTIGGYKVGGEYKSSVEDRFSKNVVIKNSSELRVGNYLLISKFIPHTVKTNWTVEQLSFVALVIADGCLVKYKYNSGCIQFGWQKKKKFEKAVEICLNALPQFGVNIKKMTIRKNRDYVIRIYDFNFTKFIAERFSIMFGNQKKYNTTINNEIFYSSLDSIKSFINTIDYFEGWHSKNRVFSKPVKFIQMSSKDFIIRYQLLLKKFGILSNYIEIKKINYPTYYRFSRSVWCNNRKSVKYKNIDVCLSKIMKIEELKQNVDVYDYSTENEVFVANGFLTHNCHYLADVTTIRYKQLSENIKSRDRVVLLSGYPVENRLSEIYVVSLISDVLGKNWFHFLYTYFNVIKKNNRIIKTIPKTGSTQKIIDLIKPYVWVSDKSKFFDEPIKKEVVIVRFELSDYQKSVINSLCESFAYRDELISIHCKNELVVFQKIMQIISGFVYEIDDNKEVNPKFFEDNPKLKLLEKIIKDKRDFLLWCLYDAEETILHKFHNRCRISKLQTDCRGLNLTTYKFAVYFTLPLSGGQFLQSVDRIYRIGRTENVISIVLLPNGEFGNRMAKMANDKHSLTREFIHQLLHCKV